VSEDRSARDEVVRIRRQHIRVAVDAQVRPGLQLQIEQKLPPTVKFTRFCNCARTASRKSSTIEKVAPRQYTWIPST
jgi:hypothetical protein